MLQVIGFEGHADDEDPCTYGAAAVSDGVHVHNLVSGSKSPIEKWSEYVMQGVVTPITPYPPYLKGSYPRGDFAALPCFILRARRDGAAALLFNTWLEAGGFPATPFMGCLESWKDGRWQYWIWASFEDLKAFMRPLAAKMREAISEFRRASTVLDPWDGMTQEEFVEAMRASRMDVRDKTQREATDDLYRAERLYLGARGWDIAPGIGDRFYIPAGTPKESVSSAKLYTHDEALKLQKEKDSEPQE